jgi:hypothetical protein
MQDPGPAGAKPGGLSLGGFLRTAAGCCYFCVYPLRRALNMKGRSPYRESVRTSARHWKPE